VLEMLESFRAPDSSLRSTYLGGGLSILAGILLLNEPELILKGVSLVLAVSFLLDGVGKGIASLRAKLAGTAWAWLLVAGTGTAAPPRVRLPGCPGSGRAVLGVVVGIRMLTSGWSMLLGREAPLDPAEASPDQPPDLRLRLPPHPAFATLNASLKDQEAA